ncbi:MAG: DUF3575 domain-containing protein [Bacteroidia bacterium]|nr:DUF3575 domain-containing protein [Bacteroidia bacterium]NNJ56439.1 DUF3575 domain-containing protein [Bacteroidia bacterium]
MKKLITLTLLLVLGCTFSLTAQDLGHRSIVKTDLKAYVPVNFNVISSINLNYEFKINKKFSTGIVGGSLIERTLELGAAGTAGSGEKLAYKGEITPTGYFLNPYFRMYTKETFNGFYVEVFARHYNYDFLIPYDYDKSGGTIVANAVANAKAYGGGLVIGNQFQFGKMFVLDIYAGAGMGVGNAHAETNDPNLDAQDFQDIKQEMADLEDVEIALVGKAINNMTYGANSTSAWADVNNYAIPMLRAGVAFGVMF